MIFPPAGAPAPMPWRTDPAGFLRGLFDAMVAAADPTRLLPGALPSAPRGRTIVVGAGKAAAAMAKATEEHWQGPLSGLVATRYGHGVPCRSIEVIEAGHPLPDSAGAAAARRVIALVDGLSRDDLVLVLLSGGGSALLTLPAPGLTIEDLIQTNRRLLASGVPIAGVNCVRKHLSAIAGGRLAVAAWPARVITFAISDVPGDDPAVIASGPTVADPSTFAQAVEIVNRYALDLPAAVRRHLGEGREETPKPGDPHLARSTFVLLATPASALEAAASAARRAGIEPRILGAEVQGEACEVASEHAAIACTLSGSLRAERMDGEPGNHPAPAPEETAALLLLSGGETTVTVQGDGRGGRNSEYLLALSLALEAEWRSRDLSSPTMEAGVPVCSDGASAPADKRETDRPAVYALAADTDGIDGTEANAGAVLYPDSLARARLLGVSPEVCLAANDSYRFFDALGDLVVTGPTRTNVNDFRAILVL